MDRAATAIPESNMGPMRRDDAAVLVVGGTGATGRLLVAELLDRGLHVRAIVRSPDKMPEHLRGHDRLSLVHAALLDLRDEEMGQHVRGCIAVASCLGHDMTLRGIYGSPRRLVTDAVRRLADAVRANRPTTPVRLVLMNTAGNRDDGESVSFGERCVVRLVRLLLPPHADNEDAADHLRTVIGPNDGMVEWVVVRPDSLIDEDSATPYAVHPSPTRSAIFDPGKTSRANVAHFMADLITDDGTWSRWKGRMPVVYNKTSS